MPRRHFPNSLDDPPRPGRRFRFDWHATCNHSNVARALFVWIAIVVPAALRPAVAQPGPPGPPAPPPNPTVAVPRHLAAISDKLSDARASDSTGRRALAEARTSLTAAQSALAIHALRTADELAASADDLVAAADGPRQHRQGSTVLSDLLTPAHE